MPRTAGDMAMGVRIELALVLWAGAARPAEAQAPNAPPAPTPVKACTPAHHCRAPLKDCVVGDDGIERCTVDGPPPMSVAPPLVTVQAPAAGATLPSPDRSACRPGGAVCYTSPAPDCPPEKAARVLCFSGRIGAIRNDPAAPARPSYLEIPMPALPPPQDTYAPDLASVPDCVWRELDSASRARVRTAAEHAPVMGPLRNWGMDAQAQGIDLVTPAHRCDPRWRFHYVANFNAWRIGVTEGLALERLASAQIRREALDAIWREDEALRRIIVSYFADVDAHAFAAARAKNAAMRPLLQAAWIKLGQKVEEHPAPESAQLAAWSYWIARGWEAHALDPLTRRPDAPAAAAPSPPQDADASAMVIARAKARADRGDYDGATALLRPAAASGDTDALVALGVMSEHGMGSAPDAVAAKGYYEQASAAGNARGRYNLALLYLEGRGTKRDPAKGLALLQQAADQDDGPALVKLAALYLVGDGVPASDEMAFALYKRAADRRDAYGEYNLGLMYDKGRGVEQNPDEARRLVALAAAHGLAEAKAAMANEQKR